MTPREIVRNTILFKNSERMPYALSADFGGDISHVPFSSTDKRPKSGIDEWGCVWENIGISNLGEVKKFPIKEWSDFKQLKIPDIAAKERWNNFSDEAAKVGDKFIICAGVSLYERVHFLRGLENTWMDIYDNPDNLLELINVLVEQNLYLVERFANAGVNGIIWCDDWGLQNRLMISPAKWKEIWFPAYRRVYQAARKAGLMTLLHSCGYIVDILDDLIEAGLDVIQMDQQENMTLDLLSKRFAGRITFWNPVDIQSVMARNNIEEIRRYAREMVRKLGTKNGGFIAKVYPDPAGAGHSKEAVNAMCSEFVDISANYKALFN